MTFVKFTFKSFITSRNHWSWLPKHLKLNTRVWTIIDLFRNSENMTETQIFVSGLLRKHQKNFTIVICSEYLIHISCKDFVNSMYIVNWTFLFRPLPRYDLFAFCSYLITFLQLVKISGSILRRQIKCCLTSNIF